MKKNLMSVIILALVAVNLVLTGIIMFSTVSANRKTIALVDDIAGILNLELEKPTEGEEGAAETEVVLPENSEVYDIADAMTVALKSSGDGKDHFAMCSVSFSINTQHEDYKTYQPMLATKESKIKSEIIEVVGSYTKEEAQADVHGIEVAILAKVQEMFDSDFVYEAYFRDIKFQ
ncbi:MAG: flagellar basal body-associated FliL family protein [Lachnospiraceae bacterium]|nr:flagellar basal body-associated FliL family protein [Lachnospiraceae bacterium]